MLQSFRDATPAEAMPEVRAAGKALLSSPPRRYLDRMAPDDDISIPGLKFPSPYQAARERAEEFRRLSPKDRMHAIVDMIRTCDIFVARAPRRDVIDRLFLRREEEWLSIQKELFRNASQSSSSS
ncbi:MAG: hypothetical protein K2X38_19115 [Gemmataceae bacterium]|nr:hypothetical protein [Gemmataceae bacterium]